MTLFTHAGAVAEGLDAVVLNAEDRIGSTFSGGSVREYEPDPASLRESEGAIEVGDGARWVPAHITARGDRSAVVPLLRVEDLIRKRRAQLLHPPHLPLKDPPENQPLERSVADHLRRAGLRCDWCTNKSRAQIILEGADSVGSARLQQIVGERGARGEVEEAREVADENAVELPRQPVLASIQQFGALVRGGRDDREDGG